MNSSEPLKEELNPLQAIRLPSGRYIAQRAVRNRSHDDQTGWIVYQGRNVIVHRDPDHGRTWIVNTEQAYWLAEQEQSS